MEKLIIDFSQELNTRGLSSVNAEGQRVAIAKANLGSIVSAANIRTESISDALSLQPMLDAARNFISNYEASISEFEIVRKIVNNLSIDAKVAFSNKMEALNSEFDIVQYESGLAGANLRTGFQNQTPLPEVTERNE